MENKKKGSVLLRVLLVLIAVIAAVLIVNRYTVRQVWCNIFSPTLPLDESAEWSGGKSYEHLPYAEDSEAQYIDLYVPDTEEPAPLFVLIHGGGFAFNDAQSRQAQFMYRYFRDHGFACASVNYRLSTEAAYPAAVSDVKAAVRYLCSVSDRYGFDAGRIAVWGESAGGYLAVMSAVSAPEAFSGTLCIGETEEKRFDMPAFDALVDYYGCIDFVTQRDNFAEEGLISWIPTLANGWANEVLTEPSEPQGKQDNTHYSVYGAHQVARLLADALCQEIPVLKKYRCDADITVSQLQSVELYDAMKDNGEDVTLRLVPKCKHADDRLFTEELLGEVEEFLRESFG